MTHPLDRITAQTISLLRQTTPPNVPLNHTDLVPGLAFSWDNVNGEVEMRMSRAEDELFTIHVTMSGAPLWLSLTLSLGTNPFAPGDVFGLITDLSSDRDVPLKLLIRSARDGSHQDITFRDTHIATPERRTNTALQPIATAGTFATSKTPHTLIALLPLHSFRLTLHDLCVFTLPAGLSPAVIPQYLSEAAF